MTNKTKTAVLEVIAVTLEDAVEAERGGAGRLEVVRELAQGGLTPEIGLVEEMRGRVKIPLRVMLRTTPDFAPTGLDELARAAEKLAALEVDGVVLGFLDDAGGLDLESLRAVLSAAPGLPATFHRAFEAVADQGAALEALIEEPQVDRILTSGRPAPEDERVAALGRLQDRAGDRLTILAGGGMDLETARELIGRTSVREIHIGTAARSPALLDAPVDRVKVKSFQVTSGM